MKSLYTDWSDRITLAVMMTMKTKRWLMKMRRRMLSLTSKLSFMLS